MSPRISGSLDEQSHSTVPSRSSSLSRDNSTRQSRALHRLAAPADASGRTRPLPQRSGSSPTSRHSSAIDGWSSNTLIPGSRTTSKSPDSANFERTQSNRSKPAQRSTSCAPALRTSMQSSKVQRWAGLTRTVTDWDLIRRDPELWYEDGDCYVHLHAKGGSRRGPSFKVPYRILRQRKCSALLDQCEAHVLSPTGSESQRLKRVPSSLKESGTMQLFIPAPTETSREESFRWHITTRNLFAVLLGKPLVGEHMGQAFVDVQERLIAYRPLYSHNHQDFLDYAENQGYRDFVECTDYALASLFYAERYKLRDVWIDAFAHCVGMNDSLALSPEYALSSRLTKALITRAYLEVELHLGRVSSALSKFLKDDLSPTYLGLTVGARNHLDRFRRFLHMYYTDKFGYWPPPKGVSFPKALYKSIYFDFKVLYDYLADTESTTDPAFQKPASGGICVLQNVDNFDQRHHFKSLPFPLPLLPTHVAESKKLDSQRALRQLTLSSQHNKSQNAHSMSAALAMATNSLGKDVADSKVLQAYMDFERSHAMNATQREDKVSLIDGRKIRWLLIYGTLQYLVSALRAPKEVRDPDSADYALCCMAEQSTWSSGSHDATPMSTSYTACSPATDHSSPDVQRGSASSIEPDCNREDYFSSKPPSRGGPTEVPTPLKFAAPARQSSLRAFTPKALSLRSSRSSRRNSLTQKAAPIVQGHENGLNEHSVSSTSCDQRPASSVYSEHSVVEREARPNSSWLRSRTPSRSASQRRRPSADVLNPRTPTLDSFQLEESLNLAPPKVFIDTPTRSDSTGSHTSSVWSRDGSIASSKTSTESSPTKTNSEVESSGLLGGLVQVGSGVAGISPSTPSPLEDVLQSHIHPLLRRPSPPNDFDFDFTSQQDAIGSLVSRHSITFSAPPSPPLSDAPLTIKRSDVAALASEKRPQPPLRSVSVEPACLESKANRSSYVFPDLPSGDLWEHYRNCLMKRESSVRSSIADDATPPPITKSVHNLRMPSLRLGSSGKATAGEGELSKKKESRRLSAFWKR